ncbi:hypothetical protein AAG570_007370 [Ranatra chinensis]|uniref:Uncharacterized protein n=1 Tax=Ranatra chinensis TaxID=642074 RepID=A0ABD0YJF7_9HEMI
MESPLSALKHKPSKGVTPKITESPPPVSGARAKAGAGLEPDAGPPGTRPNIGQTEEPRGNIKKVSETEKPASDLGENLPVTTPMVSAAESPLVSRTTECSPNVEGSVDRNSALGAKKQGTVRKDARNFTFNEAEAKKIEERNREMKERLKRIKERKATTANLLSKERTPKPQPSSSRTDGTSAAPQPKKSGPKCTQPASQRRNLQPKNKKNFTFDDKKVEDIRSQNQELRERLKRIKKRKLPSDTQGINQPRRAFHWCVRLHEDNLSSWHCVDILLNPLIHTALIGGLRRQTVLLPVYSVLLIVRVCMSLFPPVTFSQPGKGRLMCAAAKTLQPQIEEECSQPAAASGSNDVISEDEVPSIIPTVGSVCPPSRTDEHNLFSENRSLTREKEHEGEAVEAFNNLECEKHEAASKEEVPKVLESNRLASSCANRLTTIVDSSTPFFKDKEPVKELSIEECESSHDKEFFASDEASEVNYNAPKQVKKLRKRREFFDAIRKAAVRRRILTEEVNSRIAGPNLAPPASRHIVKKELPNSNGNDRPNLKIDEIHAKVNHVEEVLERLNEKCHHSKTEPVIITTKEEISKWFEEAGLFSLNSNSNKQPPIPGPSFRRSAQTSRAFKASDNPPRNPNSSHPRNDSASNDDHTQRRNLSEEVNSPIAGPNLHAPPASEHRQEEELPNSNRNDGPNYTLDTIYAKMNRVGEELDTLIQQRQTENQKEIIQQPISEVYNEPSASGTNDGSIGVVVKSIAPTVSSVCLSSRTGESQSLRKKEHENQKEIIQQPISEAYNEPSASGTNDGSIGVVVKSIAPTVSSVCLSSRTGESQSLRKKEHEVGATEAYGNQEYDGKTSVEKNSQNDGSSLAPPKHMKFSEKELPRSENQNLMNTNRYRNCEELLDKVRDTISLLNTQGKASLELSNPQNHGSSSAPPHYKKCSEKELPPSENRILMDIIWRIYCDELYEKVREIFPHLNIQDITTEQGPSVSNGTPTPKVDKPRVRHPLTSMEEKRATKDTADGWSIGGDCTKVSVKGKTSLGPSNLQYDESSSAPPDNIKFREEELPPSENRILLFIIKAFGGCKRWYGYCKELLQKVRERIPLLSTQNRGGTKGEHVPLNEELYYELGLDVQAGSGSSSGWTTDEENSSLYADAEGTTLDQVSSLAYATKPEWDNQCESEGPELTSMVDVGSMNSTFNACCPGGEGSEVSVKGTTLDQVSSLAYATKPEWDNQCESEGPELTSMVDVGSMNGTFNACCPGGEGSEVSVKGTTLDQVSSLAYATKPEWDNQCESEGPELTSMVDVGSMNSTFNACCPGGEGSEVSVKGTTLDQVSSLAYATKPEWDNQCESEGPELTSMVDVGSMNSTFNACCPGGEGSEVSVKGTTLDQVSSLAYATKPEWDNQCESEGPELTSMVDVGSMNSTFNACCPGGEGSEVSVKGTTLDQVSSLAYATKPEWDNQCESEGPELTSMVDVGSMNSTFNACCPGGEGSEVSVKGTTLDQVSSLAYATKPEWDNQCESEGPELTSMVDVGSMNSTFNACCPGGEGSEVSVKGTTLDQVSSLAYATKPEWDNQCESEGPELTSMVDVGSMNGTFNACCPGGEGSEVSVKGTTLDQVSSLAYATKPEWDNQCESEGPELTSMVDVGSMNGTFNACCPGGEGSEVSVKGTTLDQVSSVAYATTPEWNNQCESESPELTSMVDVESMNDTFNACCPESEGSDVSVKNRGGSTCDCCIITKYFASALKSARIAVGAREALPAANPALGGVQTRVMQAGSPV